MVDSVDTHPGERGEHWQSLGLFELYNTHRDLFREAHTKIVEKALKSYLPDIGTIAEIGSGAGHLYSLLPEPYRKRVVGIEGTRLFAAKQKKDFPESNVVVGDAYSLPMADSSVKAVLSYSVYDTFQDLQKAVAETKRVLLSGGKFIHFLDLQPNLGILIKDIPRDKIPFPIYVNGAFDRFVLVAMQDYERKIRPNLHRQKVKLFDLYARDPVNVLSLMEQEGSHEIIQAIAAIVERANNVEKVVTPSSKDNFKDSLVKELEQTGFKIIRQGDIGETLDVVQNDVHKKIPDKNLFVSGVGQLWQKFDPSVPKGMVRENATLQVIVAEKI